MKPQLLALLSAPIALPAAAAYYYYQTNIASSVREMGVPVTTLLGEHQLSHRDEHGDCFLASVTLPEGLRDVPNDRIFAAFKHSLGFPRSQLPGPACCWLPSDRRPLAQLGHPTPSSPPHTHTITEPSDDTAPEELYVWSCSPSLHGAVWVSVKDGFKHGERTHLHFVMGSVKSTAFDEFAFPGGALLKTAHRVYKKALIYWARGRCVEALFAGAQAVPVECKLKG